jgi:two-component system response regulator HydG
LTSVADGAIRAIGAIVYSDGRGKVAQAVHAKPRLLVVDDSPEFCDSLKNVLERMGYASVTAYDGFAALEMVKQDGFGLVVMDVRMPVMNGIETFRRMKKMAPQLPVVLLSGYAVDELATQALREGAFAMLKKPVDFERLSGVIGMAAPGVMRILIVDDNEDYCASMCEVLNRKGYLARCAGDGTTAVQMAWECDFDVAIIDLNVPPDDGLQAYSSIRRVRPNVKAIVTSGYPHETSTLLQQAFRQNVYAYIEKPTDMDALVLLVEGARQSSESK